MSQLFYSREEAKKRIKADKERAQAKAALRGPWRWWLPHDSSGYVTFLDSPEFFCDEHRVKVGDDEVFVTCVAGRNGEAECPACDAGYKRSFVAVCTIISHRSYTTKDGKTYKNQKMLLVLKGKARDAVLRQIEKRDGDLRFGVFEVARGGGATECGTGEIFEWEGRTTKKKLLAVRPEPIKDKDGKAESDEDWLKPFNYHELFKPLTIDEMKKLLGISPDSTVGSESTDERPDFASDSDPDEEEKEEKKEAKERPAIGSEEDEEKEEKPKKENGKKKKSVDIADLI